MNDELLASFSNAIGSASKIAQLGEILVDFLQGSVQFDRLNIGLIDQDARNDRMIARGQPFCQSQSISWGAFR